MTNKFTLIIPINNNIPSVSRQIKSILNYKYFTNEIVIVDVTKNGIKFDFKEYSNILNIKVIPLPCAHPGTARNAGVKNSSNDIIAFTDLNTINSKFWTKKAIKFFTQNNLDILLGKRIDVINTYFQRLLRVNSTGRRFYVTLSGSILKKNIFQHIKFVDTRSGEDIYFIENIKKMKEKKIGISPNSLRQKYYGLPNNIILAVRKWFYYNLYASRLSIVHNQKNAYSIFLFFLFFTIFLSWNSIAANWDNNNILFVPHITKIYLLLVFISYLFIRGFWTLKASGEKLKFIIFNYPLILLLSFVLDLSKAPGLVIGQFYRVINFLKKNDKLKKKY